MSIPLLISLLKSLLHALVTLVLALILLFEEWGWEPLANSLARLARLPLWGWAERRVQHLPPWGALILFFVPVMALFPVKLLALYLFGTGKKMLGLSLLIGAKLVGTAIVARLFQLTEPALMQFAWFARGYPRWKRWKDALTHQIRTSAIWLKGQKFKTRMRAWWASL